LDVLSLAFKLYSFLGSVAFRRRFPLAFPSGALLIYLTSSDIVKGFEKVFFEIVGNVATAGI
uniref:hypothetical protein n=1 Tax=Gloeocapsopsis dulcis TaxID=2859516 RepID=UPI001F3E3D5B